MRAVSLESRSPGSPGPHSATESNAARGYIKTTNDKGDNTLAHSTAQVTPLPLSRKSKRKNHRAGKKKRRKTGKNSGVAAEKIDGSNSEKQHGGAEEKRVDLGGDEAAAALCAGNEDVSGSEESFADDEGNEKTGGLDKKSAAVSETLEGEGKCDNLPPTATRSSDSTINAEEEGAANATEGRVCPSSKDVAAAASNKAKDISRVATETINPTGSRLDSMITAQAYGYSVTNEVGDFALELAEGADAVVEGIPTVVEDGTADGGSLGGFIDMSVVLAVEDVDEAGGNVVGVGANPVIEDTNDPVVAQSDTAGEGPKEATVVSTLDIPVEVELLLPIAWAEDRATTMAQSIVIHEGELDSHASAIDSPEQTILYHEVNDESQFRSILSAQKPSYKHRTVPLEVPTPQAATKAYYETRPAAGKGLGMFATRLIPRGTRIISELPLMLVPYMTYAAIVPVYASLPPTAKAAFLSLAGAEDSEELANLAWYIAEADEDVAPEQRVEISYEEQAAVQMIFGANSFSVGNGTSAIFPQASRINHSCVPNVYHTWNGHLERLTVHALRDIQRGEEILTTYISAILTREQRGDEEHLGRYEFFCGCPACKPGSRFFEESARRREAVVAIEERLAPCFAGGSLRDAFASKAGLFLGVEEALRYAQLRVELLMEEGIVNMDLVKCIHEAGELALLCGEFEEAKNCARAAVSLTETCAGKDSPHLVVLRLQMIETKQYLRLC